MSGTSIDAVDGAVILTDGVEIFEFGPTSERKYTPVERKIIQEAVNAARAWNWRGEPPVSAFKSAKQILTIAHTDAWNALIADQQFMPSVAGVHGQTVLHRPPSPHVGGATLQLIDASGMRTAFGVPLVFDFRSADMAAGGQGAPLAPAYHAALLKRLGETGHVAVLNLGGVANITYQNSDGSICAFDTGPANGPIDEWVEAHGLGTHDVDGKLAAAGQVHEGALTKWISHPWFHAPPPKSLDRFDFNASLAVGMSLEDGAATLTAFSAESVAHALRYAGQTFSQLIICGGGRHNAQMVHELQKRCPCVVSTAEDVGWNGDAIEAQAFAFLAVRSLRRLPISWPGTTNVAAPMTGGELLP